MENDKNIAKSKLVALVQSFDQWEWYRFEAFCASPYHNTQDDLPKVLKQLSKHRHNLGALKKRVLFKKILPQKNYAERQVNYWLSDLNKLAERFLAIEKFVGEKHSAELYTLESLSERHLDKHIEFLKKKKERQLKEQKQQDTADFLHPSFRFANLLSEFTYRKGERKANEHVQKAVDALDIYYFSEKLRLTCSMLNHQRVIASNYTFSFIDELKAYLESNTELLTVPTIALYYSIYKMITTEQVDAEYQAFLGLLRSYQTAFTPKELTELHEYGMNICAREIRKQRPEYVQEAFRLYKSGLELGLFLTDGMLSPWHYKNIVRLGLRTNETAWTEAFIKEKSKLLSTDVQEDALHYNLAELYFHTRNYDAALSHLNQVEFTDIHYNLGAKVMLSKIYQERASWDALESLLHAFKAFLRRNKALPSDTQKAYMNFVKWLSKIVKAPKSKLPSFKEQIETTKLLVSKDWLLEQL